jgi:uncharacterized protein YcfJ
MVKSAFIAAVSALAVAGCAAPLPNAPTVLVLPGTTKNFDQFRFDEQDCRGYAHNTLGGKAAEDAHTDGQVRSAAVGTAIGTAAGAVLGGSQGAVVGAGMGALGGAAVGADQANASSYGAQRRYDAAFTQCMYAKGHRVPVAGYYSQQSSGARPQQQAARQLPPPPPGQPPADVPPDYRAQ